MLLGKCRYVWNDTESPRRFPRAITELRGKVFWQGFLDLGFRCVR